MDRRRPDLVLMGFGMGDGGQLTLESEALLRATGRAYVIGPTLRLHRHLRRLRVRAIDLTPELDAPDPTIGYLNVAAAILGQAQADPPTLVLMPGHPLVANSLSRFLLVTAAERGVVAQAMPAVSPIDLLISLTGLDVSVAGLQIADARRFAERGGPVDPAVPLALVEPAGVTATGGGAWDQVAGLLGRRYPPEHAVLLVTTDGRDGGPRQATVATVAALGALAPPGAVLFVDRQRPQQGSAP